MTIGEVISTFKGLLKEHDSQTGVFGDEYLWKLFCIARARVLANRLRKFNNVNRQNYKTFCMEFEKKRAWECTCITLKNCEVLKSKYEIPRVICGRNKCELEIFTLGNDHFTLIKDRDYPHTQNNDILKNKLFYSIVNNHLILWNTPEDYPVAQITGLWENVEEWDNIQYCSEDDASQANCYDIFTMDSGIDMDLIEAAVPMALEWLKLPLSIIEDLTPDSNPEIKA